MTDDQYQLTGNFLRSIFKKLNPVQFTMLTCPVIKS